VAREKRNQRRRREINLNPRVRLPPKAQKSTKAFLTAKGAKQREGFGLKLASRAEDQPDNQ
jgi:hypothetical protein